MMRSRSTTFIWFFVICCGPTFGARTAHAQSATEEKVFWVAPYRADCVGVGPQKCLLLRIDHFDEWSLHYDGIEGFDYEEGYAWEIRVREEQVPNPPADAPSVRLVLLEVLSKVEALVPEDYGAPRPAPPPAIESEDLEPLPPAERPAAPAPKPVAPPSVTPEPTPPSSAPSPPPPAPAAPVAEPTPIATAPDTGAGGELYRGHLMIGQGIEARAFQLCGTKTDIWVEDATDEDLWSLYRALASFPNRLVYMMVRGTLGPAPESGFGSHYARQLTVTDLRFAAVESAGCFEELDRFAFRAQGNEPSWSAEISPRGIAFSEMSSPMRELFSVERPERSPDRIVYRGNARTDSDRRIELVLEERPCDDTMADTRYAFTAAVRIGERRLTGCAYEGTASP